MTGIYRMWRDGRCDAYTRAGARCSRASREDGYCGQHQRTCKCGSGIGHVTDPDSDWYHAGLLQLDDDQRFVLAAMACRRCGREWVIILDTSLVNERSAPVENPKAQ